MESTIVSTPLRTDLTAFTHLSPFPPGSKEELKYTKNKRKLATHSMYEKTNVRLFLNRKKKKICRQAPKFVFAARGAPAPCLDWSSWRGFLSRSSPKKHPFLFSLAATTTNLKERNRRGSDPQLDSSRLVLHALSETRGLRETAPTLPFRRSVRKKGTNH